MIEKDITKGSQGSITVQDLEHFAQKNVEVKMTNGQQFRGKLVIERYPEDNKYSPNGIRFYHLECDGKVIVFSIRHVMWIRDV